MFPPTNTDGADLFGSLALAGGTLYGTAAKEGVLGNGTLFQMNTNGTGFAVLKAFPPVDSITYSNADGAAPYGGVIVGGNSLYGTAEYGGSSGVGVVYRVDLGARTSGAWLDVQRVGAGVVWSWTNSLFHLESAASVTGSYSPVASATSPYTNQLAGTARFFRLRSP